MQRSDHVCFSRLQGDAVRMGAEHGNKGVDKAGDDEMCV